MPGGDGTGPVGGSRGRGQRAGRGGRRGGGGIGVGGECVCTACGVVQPHKTGVPCYEMKCPECGAPMQRK